MMRDHVRMSACMQNVDTQRSLCQMDELFTIVKKNTIINADIAEFVRAISE